MMVNVSVTRICLSHSKWFVIALVHEKGQIVLSAHVRFDLPASFLMVRTEGPAIQLAVNVIVLVVSWEHSVSSTVQGARCVTLMGSATSLNKSACVIQTISVLAILNVSLTVL